MAIKVERSDSFQNIPKGENANVISYLAKVCSAHQNKVYWTPEFHLSLSEGVIKLTSTSENIQRQNKKLTGERRSVSPGHRPWMLVIN